jgi:hypothetical protein
MEDAKLLTNGDSVPESETKQEIVKNRDGSDRVATRASNGMFTKKPDPLSLEETQKAIITKVTETDAQGSSVLEHILDNQIASATTPAAQPLIDKIGNPVLDAKGNPVLVIDPKVMMASAKSAQVVLKASGLEQPAKKEVPQHRVEIVNITMPPEVLAEIMKRQGGVIKEYGYKAPLTPTFAEVVEVRTNEPT